MYNSPDNNKGKEIETLFDNELNSCLSSSTMVSSLTKLDRLWCWDFRTNGATSSTKLLDFGFLVVIFDNNIQVRTIRECYIEENIQMILKKEVNKLKMV